MSKTTTKQEWRKDAQSLLETCVNIAIDHVNTNKVQIKIVNSLENHGEYLAGCEVDCYKRKQNYKFFIEIVENKTIISVYQEAMSRVNSGKYLILAEASPLNKLEYEILVSYKNMITEFLSANIVWK